MVSITGLFRRKQITPITMPAYATTLIFDRDMNRRFRQGVTFLKNRFGYGFVVNSMVRQPILSKRIDDTIVMKVLLLSLQNLSQHTAVIYYDANLSYRARIFATKRIEKLKKRKQTPLERFAYECGERLMCVVTENGVSDTFDYNSLVTVVENREVFNPSFMMFSLMNSVTSQTKMVIWAKKTWLADYAVRNGLRQLNFG